jgi:two-component system, OmpR family, sensor kinase
VLADTRRLGEIVDDLLAAADPGSKASFDDVDLAVLVQEVVASAAAHAQERGLRLTVDGVGRAVVRGSEASLRRAVLALVDNAFDHATSTVEVEVVGDRAHCRVVVSDDGPGIDDEMRPRLFQRFASAREPGSDRRHYGLGLALVADVAAAHGGSVHAGARQEGRPGAVLTLSLPSA